MIIKINGSILNEKHIHSIKTNKKEVLVNQWIEMGKKCENLFKNYIFPSSVVLSALNLINPIKVVFASTSTSPVSTSNLIVSLWPIITMIQDLALPVGIIVSIWGMVEMIIGSPGWKQKLKFAVVGYISMFIIPTFFVAIHNAFSAVPIIVPK